jgi:hypothetical protein
MRQGAKNIFSNKVDNTSTGNQEGGNYTYNYTSAQASLPKSIKNIFTSHNKNEMMVESDPTYLIKENQKKPTAASIFSKKENSINSIQVNPENLSSSNVYQNKASLNIFQQSINFDLHQMKVQSQSTFNPMNIFGEKNELKLKRNTNTNINTNTNSYIYSDRIEDSEMNDGTMVIENIENTQPVNPIIAEKNINNKVLLVLNQNKEKDEEQININSDSNKNKNLNSSINKEIQNNKVQKEPTTIEEFEDIVRKKYEIPKIF